MSLSVRSNPNPHEPPFVLLVGNKRIEPVFEFLRLLHLRGVARKTIRAYAFDLLACYRFLDEQNLRLDTLQPSHFADFILSQRKEHAAPRTINRRLVVVRSFLNFWSEGRGDELFGKTCPSFYRGMRNKALLGESRLKGRRKGWAVKVPSILMTPLTAVEIQKFFCGIRKYRDQAMVCLMVFVV